MRKLRIGLVVIPGIMPVDGGGFSYYASLLQGINQYHFDEQIEIVNVVLDDKNKQLSFDKETIFIKPFGGLAVKKNKLGEKMSYGFVTRLKNIGWISRAYRKIKLAEREKTENYLHGHGIDVLYYLVPNFDPLNYPFLMTNWDVGHRSCYPFPELVMNGEYESRENYYINRINKAIFILCESKAGATELTKYYNIEPRKLKVIPLFGNAGLSITDQSLEKEKVLKRYQLQQQSYFLYPAQLWAHKNHINLLRAFSDFIKATNNNEVKLLLCGDDKGNKVYIQQTIEKLQLKERVVLAGFVAEKELHIFYRNALSLVMPTFLGPTNMPLIEAAMLGCPVICSDLKGHREILGPWALYFNPSDYTSISQAMATVFSMEDRDDWIAHANNYIKNSEFQLQHSLTRLNEVFLQVAYIRQSWA